MTGFQLKIITGLLFSIAVTSGIFLILPEKKSAVSNEENNEQTSVVKVEQKKPNQESSFNQKKSLKTEKSEAQQEPDGNAVATADQLDAFFSELGESEVKEIKVIPQWQVVKAPEKAPVKVVKKNQKLALDIDNILNPEVFALNQGELKKKFKYRFISEGYRITFPKGKSQVFPKVTKKEIAYGPTGLYRGSLFFRKVENPKAKQSWVKLWYELREKLKSEFGCDFKWENRLDGSVLGKSDSNIGLKFICVFYSPESQFRDSISYIQVSFGVEERKLRPDQVRLVKEDSDLRALANYCESEKFISPSTYNLAVLTKELQNILKEDQISGEDPQQFYTEAANEDLYSVEMADRCYPKIVNFIGTELPNADTYQRWTMVYGLVKKIELVTDGQVKPLLKVWHKNGLPVLTVQYLSAEERMYYFHEYEDADLKRIIALKQSDSVVDLEFVSRVSSLA